MRAGRAHLAPLSPLARLACEQRSAGAQAVLPTRAARRFHANQRGNMTLLLLLTILVLWAMSGLIWNTGTVISAKIHNQTAADTAAYTAAVWNARTVNLVTGLNRQLVRICSAEAVAWAMPFTAVWIIVNWVAEIAAGVAELIATYGASAPEFIEMLVYIFGTELPAVTEFFGVAFPLFAEWGNTQLCDRANEIAAMEKAAIMATPGLINEDLQWLNDKFFKNVEIKLFQPFKADADLDEIYGSDYSKIDMILPPLKEGGYGSIFVPSLIQLFRDCMRDGSWYDYDGKGLKYVDKYGRGKQIWPFACIVSLMIVHAMRDSNYELVNTTGAGFYQPMPSSDGDWNDDTGRELQKYFSVVAVAQGSGASQRMTMTKLFNRQAFSSVPRSSNNWPNDVCVCYGQAEMYNPIAMMFEDWAAVDAILGIFPWQTCSTWGWQWTARLAPAENLTELLEHDEAQDAFDRWVGLGAGNNVERLNLH